MASNGCFIAALIARTHDRLPLCSYTDENYSNANVIRQQEQRIVERMETPAGGTDRAAAKGSYYESFDHKDNVYFAFQDAATDLTLVVAVNKLLLRNSGDINGTNKLACGLLDLIFAEFIQMYTTEEITAPNLRAYQFIKFDTTLRKCVTRIMQQDRTTGDGIVVGNAAAAAGHSGGGANGAVGSGGGGTGMTRRQVNPHYDALRQEITDVHMVMRKNLEDLMTRGEGLDTMTNYSAELVDQSSRYYRKTVQMNRMRLLKTYGPPAVIGTFLILFFYFYFF
ncbi:putative Qc-SNARE protein [Leptomonas pyrrhocoris]|uniref:Putative Qc-SNARE protein n=1 Tax=Leptomonas pyrrhocoris TaxID=157538 RepID=A0A0M9G5L8_LEPPY|nr:putative Qc-SNARE protein [Leptomonas pyrrhocoris]XP_015661098.1 putative Qc-SNARE protein [Leptomonas pyrrhocoris]KPA82658.1 putative Qc-SNARE protein [Leptomonas pyrrhocoris]KPA82659.1 putative Qc-SNARE protein [Leptomonas pyrrhocoris]|eukprot:XP_015661097.1 putative Qc-SNARE protein [Leptomonas pyrrhocoris]